MGQRFQIIVSIPKIYYNEKNPNNKDRQFLIYHNQWLYRATTLIWAKKYIESITESLKDPNKYTKTLGLRDLEDARRYANVISMTDIRNSHRYEDEKNENDNSFIAQYTNWDALLDGLDNNNGYLFIYVDDKKEVSYCLLNGLEDDDEIKIRTPLEYLKLFYKDLDDFILESPIEWIETLKYLTKQKSINYKKIIMPRKNVKKVA